MKDSFKKGLATTVFMTVMSSCIVFTGCEKSSDEQTDLYKYMGFLDYTEEQTDENSVGQKPAKDQAAVVAKGEVTDYRAVIKEGKPYVDIRAVQQYVDKRFYWDSVEGYVMFTNATDIYSSYVGEKECYLNGTAENLDYAISYVENEQCYISMDFVKKFVDMDFKYYKAQGDEPARVCLYYGSSEDTVIKAKKKNPLRTQADLMSPIVVKADKSQEVTVLSEENDWYRVQTEDGFIGYVSSKYWKDKTTKKVERKNDDATYTHTTMENRVKLVWHQVTNTDANYSLGSMISEMKDMNVISPTWYTLSDKKGNITDLSSSEYVQTAHNAGLKVWALVDDFSANSKGEKYAKSVLATTSKRQKLEDEIIHSVIKSRIDGINIDFEYVAIENDDDYLQFLREMYIKCKKNSIVLSVDNYVPTEWSEYYDIAHQAKVADYIVVMSYDEHTTASDEAGPVASLSFVKKSVEDTVALAKDSSRVIMGIPFYTRIWKETPEEDAEDGSKIIEDSINGNYALSSEAVGMDDAKNAYKKAGVQPAWNEETGTNYVYYEKGKSRYMIWLEDADSIKQKLKVANDNNIGGIGCWKLGLENSEIWSVLDEFK